MVENFRLTRKISGNEVERLLTSRKYPVQDKGVEKLPTCKKKSGNKVPFHDFFFYNLITDFSYDGRLVLRVQSTLCALCVCFPPLFMQMLHFALPPSIFSMKRAASWLTLSGRPCVERRLAASND